MKKGKKVFVGAVVMALVLMLSVMPAFAWYTPAAVGYDKVPTKMWGFNIAIGVQPNVRFNTSTLASVTNKNKKSVSYTKTVTMSRNISVGYASSSTISQSISLQTGKASNSLGKTIENSYNMAAHFDRTESDTIKFTVKPNKTVKIVGTCYGTKVMVYYKYFKLWKPVEKGCATFYIPTGYSFTVQ